MILTDLVIPEDLALPLLRVPVVPRHANLTELQKWCIAVEVGKQTGRDGKVCNNSM